MLFPNIDHAWFCGGDGQTAATSYVPAAFGAANTALHKLEENDRAGERLSDLQRRPDNWCISPQRAGRGEAAVNNPSGPAHRAPGPMTCPNGTVNNVADSLGEACWGPLSGLGTAG